MTPQWMTQERLTQLVKLRQRYGGLCLKGHAFCPVQSHWQWVNPHQETVAVSVEHPVLDKATGGIRRDITRPGWAPVQVTVWEWELANLADAAVEETISQWQADDRELRALDWKREQRTIHDGAKGRFGRPFDPVARDVFMAQQPEFYLTATGMDGVHFRPRAVVRVPSTAINLFVDVAAAFVQPTKSTGNQRRLARCRGKPIQEVTQTPVTVEELCQQAVASWWRKTR